MHNWIRILCMVLVLMAGVVRCCSCSVWQVNWDGGGDFQTLRAACSAALDGDTLFISPGYYDEGDTPIFLEEKGLAMIGSGVLPDDTILRVSIRAEDCQGMLVENLSIRNALYPLRGTRGSISIRRCTIRENRGAGTDYGPVHSRGSDLIVDECIFANNANVDGIAGALGGGPLTVRRSVFVGNVAGEMGGAIDVAGNSTVEDCVFFRNEARTGAALALRQDPIVRRCTFLENRAIEEGGSTITIAASFYEWISECIIAGTVNGFGIDCWWGVASLWCCDLWNNDLGQYSGWCDTSEDWGNFSEDPLFCDPETGDVGLLEGSPCLPGNHGGVECGLIGAKGLGCGDVPVIRVTWGEVKALYK